MHTRTVDLTIENLLEITDKFEAFFHPCCDATKQLGHSICDLSICFLWGMEIVIRSLIAFLLHVILETLAEECFIFKFEPFLTIFVRNSGNYMPKN
jgi:hypothetical protein